MKKGISILLATSILATGSIVNAGYKDAFDSPSRGSDHQIILGIGEVVAAVVTGIALPFIFNDANSKIGNRQNFSADLVAAESKLADAANMLTYQERQAMITKMLSEVQKNSGHPDFDSLYEKVQRDIAEIEQKKVVTPLEKQVAVRKARIELTSVRARNLKEAMRVGKVRLIRNFVIVGEAIFILDIGQRIYVYNALDKDPTFSPSLTYAAHLIFPNDVSKKSNQ